MRKNKIRRLMAAALTAAMVVSMGGMSAFAASYVVPSSDNKITLTKTIKASGSNADNGNLFEPNTTVNFGVRPATEDEINNKVDNNNSHLTIYQGIQGGVSSSVSIPFTPGTGDEKKYFKNGTVTGTTDIELYPSAFYSKVPGIYRYVITEDTGDYDGLSYGGAYYLDVYVENILNDDGSDSKNRSISYVVVSKMENDTLTKADLIFEDTYTTHNVSVTKKITGNQADMNATFAFTIRIDGAVGEKYYVKQGNTIDTLTSGTEKTFTLGHTDTVEIIGLSEADTYTVIEQKANEDGYTTKYSIDNIEVQGTDCTITVGSSQKTVQGLDAKVEGNADKAVVVENNKATTTPTGIALSFAPYALLVVLAGVFGVLFLRKRRDDEI